MSCSIRECLCKHYDRVKQIEFFRKYLIEEVKAKCVCQSVCFMKIMKFLKVDWNFLFRCVFRTQGGLDDAAIGAGLNKPIDIRLARKELTKNSPIMYAINTDDQLKIELPLITSDSNII